MALVEMYFSPLCSYCTRARRLLEQKGIAVQVIDVLADSTRRLEMQQRSGRTSVPQVFIDGKAVGGCDDLHALEAEGRLDALLASGS